MTASEAAGVATTPGVRQQSCPVVQQSAPQHVVATAHASFAARVQRDLPPSVPPASGPPPLLPESTPLSGEPPPELESSAASGLPPPGPVSAAPSTPPPAPSLVVASGTPLPLLPSSPLLAP